MKVSFFALGCLGCLGLFWVHFPATFAQSFTQTPPSYLPDQLILKVADSHRSFCGPADIQIPELNELFGLLGVKEIKKIFPTHHTATFKTQSGGVDLSLIYQISYQNGEDASEAARRFHKLPFITYAEPRFVHQLFYQPNDPISDTTGGLEGPWYLSQIKAREAWDVSKGDSSVVIAIVDSGFEGDHPDMTKNLFKNLNDPPDGVDNDNDGYTDNYIGWDLAGDSYYSPIGDFDPFYGSVHGFRVAGFVGAETDNGIGMSGVSFNCSYMPIKVAPDDSIRAITHGYEGIIYAVDHGADIVNCSWGSSNYSQFGEDIIQYATVNRQAAVICAAGNGTGFNNFEQAIYPAAFANAISVANTDRGDTASYNTTYHHTVDLAAPGIGMLTVNGTDDYTWAFQGTSASAPVVAAAVGLTLSHYPQLTPFQAAQRIRVTTDDIYAVNVPVFQDKLGSGRLNMFKAVSAPLKPSIRMQDYLLSDLDGDDQFIGGDTVVINLSAINYLHPSSDLNIAISVPIAQASLIEIVSGGANPGAVPMMGAFETGESLKIRLAPGLPDNYEVIIKVSYLDPANAYVDFEYFSFFVNRSWINLEANQIHTSITSSGNFGYHDFPYNQEGEGLRFRDQSNVLFEGGLLIGKSISQVSDNIRNTNGRDQDFAVQQAIAFVENPTKADVEAISVFRDNVSANPIGVEITQHIYAFEDQERENFVLMEYSIKNESAAPLANLYGGLFADWDILAALANRNVANYDDTSRLVFAYDFTGVNPNYYGIGLVSDDNFYAEAGRTNYFPFTSSGKFGALVNAPSPSTATQGATTGGTDIFQFISSGPISLAPQAQDTLVFALLAGQNYTQLEQAQEAAKNSYECRILAKGPLEAFTISDAFAKVGESVSFQDQNSQASSWQWDFGDGFTSDQANPSHTYALAGVYTVTLTVSDGYCEETTAQTVYIDFATDLEDLTQQLNWSLYPNPTQGQLSVRMSGHWTGTFSWRLLDMQGREIWRESARKGQLEEQYQISLPSLPAGLYQFVWQGPQGKKVHPLMVR